MRLRTTNRRAKRGQKGMLCPFCTPLHHMQRVKTQVTVPFGAGDKPAFYKGYITVHSCPAGGMYLVDHKGSRQQERIIERKTGWRVSPDGKRWIPRCTNGPQ
jgi:hypothetical protein